MLGKNKEPLRTDEIRNGSMKEDGQMYGRSVLQSGYSSKGFFRIARNPPREGLPILTAAVSYLLIADRARRARRHQES
jgi:hypothetical protein